MKAILVLNETPKNCKECDEIVRKGCKKGDFRKEERPKTCPLIEINNNIARLIEVAR